MDVDQVPEDAFVYKQVSSWDTHDVIKWMNGETLSTPVWEENFSSAGTMS